MIDSISYYRVKDQIFQDKIQAILYANSKKDEIEWYFNDNILTKVDWTKEPETSLDEFYRIRAQQIRDKYDYLVVMYSGGADSNNVVWSFLNNGILIDEIVAAAPISGLNNYNFDSQTVSTSNVISETKYAQIPGLQDIKNKFPNIKITFNDYFEDMIHYKTDEWLYKSSDWIHPTTVARYSLEKFKHLKDLAEAGKRMGIIYGIDKPVLFIEKNRNINLTISDLAVNVPRPAFDNLYVNVENVLFYYTADLPQMLVKQAHVVASWFFDPSNYSKIKYIRDAAKPFIWEENRKRLSNYEKLIIPIIYPSTHRNVFQGHKPTKMFMADHDDWFYDLHKETRTYQMIMSDFNMFIKNIDKKYLSDAGQSFKFFNKNFTIGHINKFQPLF